MASNEHKNLTDVNRHNPKGFENALNSTVLCKTAGTGTAQQDGTLNWQSKSNLGSVNYKISGYITSSDYSSTNYFREAHISDNKSPFHFDVDTDATSVSSISLTGNALITRANNYVVSAASTIYKIYGWISSSGSNTTTLALAKVTPTANTTSANDCILIKEIAVTGLGNQSKLIEIDVTSFDNATLAKGDYVVAFIKDSGGGDSNIYWQVNVCTTQY